MSKIIKFPTKASVPVEVPEVAKPITLDDLDPDQLTTFCELVSAYEALIEAGVDKYRLFASMPTI